MSDYYCAEGFTCVWHLSNWMYLWRQRQTPLYYAIETRIVRMACGSSTTSCCMIEGCEWPFALRTRYIAQRHNIAFEIRNGQTSIETFIDHEEIQKYKHPWSSTTRIRRYGIRNIASCRYPQTGLRKYETFSWHDEYTWLPSGPERTCLRLREGKYAGCSVIEMLS